MLEMDTPRGAYAGGAYAADAYERADDAETDRPAGRQPQARDIASEGAERSILEALDEGVLVVDLSGRVLQANRAARSILGLDSTALQSPDWWKSLRARRTGGGPTLEQVSVGAEVLRTGRGVRDVAVELDRDGTIVHLSMNCVPLRDGHEPVTGLVVSFRDVTAREQDTQRLVEAEERLRKAHEVAQLYSWEWKPRTDEIVIFEASAGHGVAFGLDSLLDTMPADARRVAQASLQAMARGELDKDILCWSRPRAESRMWLETRSHAVRQSDGTLLSIRGTSQDVTDREVARQQAVTAQDFLQATVDSLPAHIAVLDEHSDVIMTNRAWTQFALAGSMTPSDGSGNYLAVCDAAGDDEHACRVSAGLRAILDGTSAGFTLEYPCHGPDVEQWYLVSAARFEGRGRGRVVVAHSDVSDRHRAEGHAATHTASLDEVDVAVIAVDEVGCITHWNRGAERSYGWTSEEALGRLAAETVIAADRNNKTGPLHREFGEGELLMQRKNGSTFPAYIRACTRFDAAGIPVGVIGVSVDISERIASERALRATRNYLRAVTDSMGQGLFTIDLEGRLSYMNDVAQSQLGWTQKELQGRVMHDVIHSRTRDGSVFPREECPIRRARRDRVTVRVEDDLFITRGGGHLPVAYTASPFHTDEGAEGCIVVFDDISDRKKREEQLQREADKLPWIRRIADALANDRFELYGQPIIDIRTGAVAQCELLLRMHDPDGGVVAPGEYLHIAEQFGQIGAIDRWVISEAAAIAATGRPVEVNVSARSIGDPAVIDHIEDCIRDAGADPANIVFEITETTLVEDEDAAREFAARLRALGCKLALDDFGTGYGTFTYLKHLPVDFLKVDVEFVRDLATNAGSRHVVQAVVALARGFGLKTVAEGVEDARTLALLTTLGVDFAQGFHIGRPAPLDPYPQALPSAETRSIPSLPSATR